MIIRSFAALAVTALALQALPAKAQTSGSSSTSSSGSTSSSSSGSNSGASTTSGTSSNSQGQRTNQRVNSTTNIPITFNSADPAGTGGGGSAGGYTGSSTPGGPTGQPYYGQSDITVRTTPTVYAPPVSGGNPCTLAVSGGLSVIGWGAAAGGTFVDQECAQRQKIAMIHNSGQAAAARELMCLDRDTYNAFKRVGQPCVFNAAFEPPGTPPTVQPQPVPLAPAPQQQVIVKDKSNLPRCSRTVTDNCFSG
jgi:hypothetical protein